MKKFGLIIALAAMSPVSAIANVDVAAAAEAAAVTPVVGKMLYSADGKKLAAIYKIDAAGSPQILLDGKLVTIPVSTLSEVEGKFATSLTRRDVMARR